MSLLNILRGKRKSTASIAKERLQIIISHERTRRSDDPDYLVKLQREIVDVIAKYVKIDKNAVNVQLKRDDGKNATLELNITMPEGVVAEEEPA